MAGALLTITGCNKKASGNKEIVTNRPQNKTSNIVQSNFSTSDGIACNQVLDIANEVKIYPKGNYRIIKTNSIPDHSVGTFPNAGNPNTIAVQNKIYKVPLNPKKTGKFISVYSRQGFGKGMPQYEFGVAINGVNMEPSAMEAFENPKTGERNFDWTLEALSTAINLGDDCNNAQVQPTSKYHYHGTPQGIVKKANGKTMFLTGWAADGFPIYYKYGYKDANDATSGIITLTSSYRLKKGNRPGDGVTAPNGAYNGTYVRDFEYIKGAGTLDEANGRHGVTPEFPKGTYYYVITDEFPSISRYFVGTPANDFKLGGGQLPQRERRGRRQRNGQNHPSPDKIMADLDNNGDQKISRNEAKGPLKRDFNRIDRNQDGFITKDEMRPPRRR